jgi:uncharacterized MAPEG superfamily protein
MVLVVLLVLALFVLQTLIPGRFREAPAPGGPNKLQENLGPRDHMRPLTVAGQRAARALANLHEAIPVFIALALMNMIVAPQAALAVTGAWIFFIARIVYLPLYIHGVTYVRTLAWIGGWVGLVLMIIPLVRAMP